MTTPSTPDTAAPLTPPDGRPDTGAVTLARELADFLIELSIALHKHAIYPAGHPLVADAVTGSVRRVQDLMVERPSLAIGVARRQLVIEGVATDASHPLLRELAQRLHRHHVGAIKLLPGITTAEWAEVLVALAQDAARLDAPLGLAAARDGDRWPHVRLFPLTYDKLELLEDDGDEGAGAMGSGRAAQLWVGLARAALVANADEQEAPPLEPTVVARAIEQHQREEAYDQVVVGYLLQIATELRSAQATESAALRRRVSRLVTALDPETLAGLVAMGGDAAQRRRFALDAAQGLAAEAVVSLAQAAAAAEGETISHSMLRLLAKLARHAEEGPPAVRTEADSGVREAVLRLVSNWSLDDPNPDAYRAALQTIARAAPAADTGAVPATCEPERLIQIGAEVGTLGPSVWRAVDAALATGRVAMLVGLAEGAPTPELAGELWEGLVQRGALHHALLDDPADARVIDGIVGRMGAAAAPVLLDALVGADAALRDVIAGALASLGEAAVPAISERVAEAEASVARVLLGVVARLPRVPDDLPLAAVAKHPDATVRKEALRLMLRRPSDRDAAIAMGLNDADEGNRYLALQAASEGCSRALAELVRARLERGELAGALRPVAIRAAATARTPQMLAWLVARVTTRSRIMHRLRLRDPDPEMLAALNCLAAGWASDAGAAETLELARSSTDAAIRRAATGVRQTTPLGIPAVQG